MTKSRILFWTLTAALLFMVSPCSWAARDASYFLDKTITSEEFSRAYLAIYNDRISGGDRYTDDELSDVVEAYKTSSDVSDLWDALSRTGPRSNEAIGSILERAGASFGTRGSSDGGPKAVYWCTDAIDVYGQSCCVDENSDPGYCWQEMRCDYESQQCVYASPDPVCGNGMCEAGETERSCPQDCGSSYCSDHDECSQACTASCPYGVFGCCDGCRIGQCIKGQCQCQEATNYCSNPTYQAGTECNGGTDTWCYDAVTEDGWGCCVDQDSDPGYCWMNEYCDPYTNTCM